MKRKNTEVERLLLPDFSEFVENGKFNGVMALENHYNLSTVFLDAAEGLMDEDHNALMFLEAFREAMRRGIDEAYEHGKREKAA